MASNTEKIFTNFAQSRLAAAITNAALTCELIDAPAHLFPTWETGKEFYMTLVDASANREIIKITAISGYRLTIERGQGGTSARAWPLGTLIEQRPVAGDLSAFRQEEVYRQVAYNPNTVLAAQYPGEKILQIGADSCQKRWWKNVSALNWQLIAGEMCSCGESLIGGWTTPTCTWHQKLDDTEWGSSMGDFTWDGSKWVLSLLVTNESLVNVNPAADDVRCFQLSWYCSASVTVHLILYDEGAGIILEDTDYLSGKITAFDVTAGGGLTWNDIDITHDGAIDDVFHITDIRVCKA